MTGGGKPADILTGADYMDIDAFLKPAGAADYDTVFASGRMVLPYTDSEVGPAGRNLPPIADLASGPFNPPDSIPRAVSERCYRVANLYNDLLGHYFAIPATSPASAKVLSQQFDFQLICEHGALAAARALVMEPGLGIPGSGGDGGAAGDADGLGADRARQRAAPRERLPLPRVPVGARLGWSGQPATARTGADSAAARHSG